MIIRFVRLFLPLLSPSSKCWKVGQKSMSSLLAELHHALYSNTYSTWRGSWAASNWRKCRWRCLCRLLLHMLCHRPGCEWAWSLREVVLKEESFIYLLYLIYKIKYCTSAINHCALAVTNVFIIIKTRDIQFFSFQLHVSIFNAKLSE